MSGNPVFVESGRRGARQRWGPPRVAKLGELSGPQRELVLALIASMTKTESADGQIPADSLTGGTSNADRQP